MHWRQLKQQQKKKSKQNYSKLKSAERGDRSEIKMYQFFMIAEMKALQT